MFLERDSLPGKQMEGRLVLLQVWLGVSTFCGCLIAGALTIFKSRSIYISKRLLLQISEMLAAISMLSLYCTEGFHGYVMFAWMYGLSLGSYLYTTKIFCYSIVKTKDFSRIWSLVQASQALPSLLGITITGYINSEQDKTGYWFSLIFVVIGATLLSLLPEEETVPFLVSNSVLATQVEKGNRNCPNDFNQRFALGDIDDAQNLSMSCNSKVDRFLLGGGEGPFNTGDLNGNLKAPRNSELQRQSGLSYSDPEGLNSPDIISEKNGPAISQVMKRGRTWHRLISSDRADRYYPASGGGRVKNPGLQQMLVVDQITSTV